MAKGPKWLSWQKGPDGYHGRRDQMAIMVKGPNGYHSKMDQMAMMVKKRPNGYHAKMDQKVILSIVSIKQPKCNTVTYGLNSF